MSAHHRFAEEDMGPTTHPWAMAVLYTIGLAALLVVRGAFAPDTGPGTGGAVATVQAQRSVAVAARDHGDRRPGPDRASTEGRTR
jgi:hypothetical protein